MNIGGQELRGTVSFSPTMTILEARAEIPELRRVKSDRYEIDDSTEVGSAIVASGNMSIDVSNETELPFIVAIHSPNFKYQDIEFNLSGVLLPHSARQYNIDVAGYTFTPQGPQDPEGGTSQSVLVEMVSTSPPTAPERLLVRSTDSLCLLLQVSDIAFQSLTGRLRPTLVEIDPVTRLMDLPDGIDRSRLTNARLYVNADNDTQVPAFLDLLIEGGGKAINLSGPVAPKSDSSAPPMVTTIHATREQSDYFFNPPPSSMVISGAGVINPDYLSSDIFKGDFFSGEVIFDSPFAIAFEETLEIEPQITTLEIGDSRPMNLAERAERGSFAAALENHLPFGVMVSLFLGIRGDSTLYGDPSTICMGPYMLEAAVVGEDGTVITPSSSSVSDSLDGSRFGVFEEDSLFIGERIELLPTDSAGVIIDGDDYLHTRAIARVRLKLGG
jgi:hypothetical protein